MDEREQDINEYMDYLFEIGAMIPSGMDESGEMTFQWADDAVLLSIDPELLGVKDAFMSMVFREIEDSLIDMFEEGLVDMDIDDELQTVWTITDKGREVFRDEPE